MSRCVKNKIRHGVRRTVSLRNWVSEQIKGSLGNKLLRVFTKSLCSKLGVS